MADKTDYFFPGDVKMSDLYPEDKTTIVKWEETTATNRGLLFVGRSAEDRYVIVQMDWPDLELFMQQVRTSFKLAVSNGILQVRVQGDN